MTPVQITWFRNHLRSFGADSVKPNSEKGRFLVTRRKASRQLYIREEFNSLNSVSVQNSRRGAVANCSIIALRHSHQPHWRHQEPHKIRSSLSHQPLHRCLQKATSTVILLNRFGHPWVRYLLSTTSPLPLPLLLYFSRDFSNILVSVGMAYGISQPALVSEREMHLHQGMSSEYPWDLTAVGN